MSKQPIYEALQKLGNLKSLTEATKDEGSQEDNYIVSDEVSDDLSELRGYNLRAETYGAGRYKVIGNYDELVRWIKSTRRDQRWIDSTIKSIRKLNDKKARKSRLDPLKAAKKHFEKSVDFEAEDFRSYDAYDEYLEYLDLGPEDFYYTFEDDFNWDPDFVAKYGSDVEESCKTNNKKKIVKEDNNSIFTEKDDTIRLIKEINKHLNTYYQHTTPVTDVIKKRLQLVSKDLKERLYDLTH